MNNGVFDNNFWWKSESEPHSDIASFVRTLREEQDQYYTETAVHSGLYNGRPTHSRFMYGMQGYASMRQPRLTFNIIHSICQAATAKIAKHRPAVNFLTEGGAFSQQRKAKQFTKLMQGLFYSLNIYSIAQRVFLDCCITGTGVMKIFAEHGKVKVERVPIWELTLDPVEAENGNMPRQLFQTKKVSRHMLAEMFPEKRQQILDVSSKTDEGYDNGRDSDMIECHEAWHLPSGPEATDGRHVICVHDVTLLDEEWSKDHFPFAFLKWSENPMSFWGNGLTKEVKGIQIEINKLLARIQEQMHLATPKVFIEDTSKIVQTHLSNKVWGAITYRGTPPQFFVPRAVSGEMFSHLDRLVERAYEMTGISQLAAQSKKPVGLESGRALREFSDIESERFMVVGQAYERLFVDVAEQAIEMIKDLHDDGNPYTVASFDRNGGLEQIDWDEIDLDEDQYIMQVKPIGSLPQTPAAKLASVNEMMLNGMFSKEEAHQLLDFPDLETANKLKTAHIEVIDLAIERMLEDGEYIPPEPYMALEYGISRIQQAYNLAIINDEPEDRRELLRRWLAQADSMMAPPPAMPQGPAPSPMSGPMAGPPPGPMPGPMPPGLPPGMAGPPGLPPGLPPGPPAPPEPGIAAPLPGIA
jgi:hypothetical protein